jgi:hypothetical protein
MGFVESGVRASQLVGRFGNVRAARGGLLSATWQWRIPLTCDAVVCLLHPTRSLGCSIIGRVHTLEFFDECSFGSWSSYCTREPV